jgi:hypothetical protein
MTPPYDRHLYRVSAEMHTQLNGRHMMSSFFKNEPVSVKASVTNDAGISIGDNSVAYVARNTNELDAGDTVMIETWDKKYTFETVAGNIVSLIDNPDNPVVDAWQPSGPDCWVLNIFGTHIMRLDDGLWYLFDDMEPFMRVQLVADLDESKRKAEAYAYGEDDE